MLKSKLSCVWISILFIITCSGVSAQLVNTRPIRVDLSPDFRRNDTVAPHWREWPVQNGQTAIQRIDDISVTIRQGEPDEVALEGQWYKKALAAGARMACDGVFVSSGSMEIVLQRLKPGPHTLVTYHNSLWDEEPGSYRISIAGTGLSQEATPSRQAMHDEDAASAYLTFHAAANRSVVVRIERNENDKASRIILNGLEIDAQNPVLQPTRPTPFHGDLHADGDSGRVALKWRSAAGAIRHRVYFVSNRDPDLAAESLAASHPNNKYLLGISEKTEYATEIRRNDSLMHYAWRVDSVDAKGVITPGDIWTFRARHLAFPGAEGYGRFALGGRGGRVYHITNLNDAGPGSFREAVEAEGARTVVFDVGGLISLKSKLVFRNPFLTVAGHTAPGKGICIRNFTFGGLGAGETVIRHVRLRLGDLAGKTMDGMGLAASDHCIIDHCSLSWTQDEVFSSRAAGNITLQRCLISEALNVAGHKKYGKGAAHGFAASIGGDIGSFHHNLLAHCAGRNWSLAGGLNKAAIHTGRLDIRNNVVYNWGHRTTDGGARYVQFVNNYYKPGPASRVFHVLKPERNNIAGFGPQDYYVAGNVMEGRYGPEEPLAGVVRPKEEPLSNFIMNESFFDSFVQTETAREAYENVLADVGCNVPCLDEHDQRVIQETRQGETTYKGSRTGLPGLPDTQEDVGGWEEYPEVRRPAGWDTDGDGMPDHWEKRRGFDPQYPADGVMDADGDGYTNLEEYLNVRPSSENQNRSKALVNILLQIAAPIRFPGLNFYRNLLPSVLHNNIRVALAGFFHDHAPALLSKFPSYFFLPEFMLHASPSRLCRNANTKIAQGLLAPPREFNQNGFAASNGNRHEQEQFFFRQPLP